MSCHGILGITSRIGLCTGVFADEFCISFNDSKCVLMVSVRDPTTSIFEVKSVSMLTVSVNISFMLLVFSKVRISAGISS